jgi:hypothetical protein
MSLKLVVRGRPDIHTEILAFVPVSFEFSETSPSGLILGCLLTSRTRLRRCFHSVLRCGLSFVAALRIAHEAEAGAPCRCHPSRQTCGLPSPGETDIAIVCTPCQPFSKMRDARSTPPELHKGYSITFGESGSVLSLAGHLKPAVLLVEQVAGMEKSSRQGGTYKRRLLDAVLNIPDEAGTGSHFAAGTCLSVDVDIFMNASRPRFPDSF